MLNLMTPDEMYCFTIKNPMGHLWRVYEVPDDCSANRASVFAVSEPVINTFSKCHTISLSVKKGKKFKYIWNLCEQDNLRATLNGSWQMAQLSPCVNSCGSAIGNLHITIKQIQSNALLHVL